jgi:hypothetical protein
LHEIPLCFKKLLLLVKPGIAHIFFFNGRSKVGCIWTGRKGDWVNWRQVDEEEATE